MRICRSPPSVNFSVFRPESGSGTTGTGTIAAIFSRETASEILPGAASGVVLRKGDPAMQTDSGHSGFSG